MDRSSVIGILLAITAIIGGNLIEGGRIDSILQLTAAVIVFGGTLGATLLSFPLSDIVRAASSLKEVFFENTIDARSVIEDIIRYSITARKHGLLTLDEEVQKIDSSFLKTALRLALDGMPHKTLRETMEQENVTYESERRRTARVFETAGGFAPTIGIIGAVLGLIHVMENLAEPAKLGTGIAVAFVATVYGVGSANLILLPIAKKLINKLHYELYIREMMLEGVIGIQSGINPYYLEEKLNVFLEKRQV